MRLTLAVIGILALGLLGPGAVIPSANATEDVAHKGEKHADAKAVGHDDHGHAKPFSIFPDKADLGLWSLVVFLGLFYLLSKYAWKPMVGGLQQRELSIREALEAANKAREEANLARANFKAESDKAQAEVRALLENARKEAVALREEELARTKAEISQERERAHREIEIETDQALQKIWSRTADLATQVSASAIRKQLDMDAHRRLIDEAVRDLKTSSN